jgi:hypothetical protein
MEEGSLQNEPSGHCEAEEEPAVQYCRKAQTAGEKLPFLQKLPGGQMILLDELEQ